MDDANLPSKPGPSELQIAVLGLGYVGLPTALGLAELGWQVTGADEDSKKVALLSAGKSPFYENGLQELLTKHLSQGTFKVTRDVDSAVRSAAVLFVCVGTPQKESGQADLSQIEAIARVIARNLNGYKLIVEKSTVPAITAQWIKRTVALYARPAVAAKANGASAGDLDSAAAVGFEVASNPEFLQEGTAVKNFFRPDRVVIGVESDRAREVLEAIYRPLDCNILVTNLSTAELIKHAANAFLAAKISFINMVADLCEELGADVAQVASGLGLDPRIGPSFLSAGVGFGGYCLPKDLRAFIYLAEEHGVDCGLLKEIERINLRRLDVFLKKVRQALWVVQGKTIGVLGLAFKPGTDDIREARSLKIVEALLKESAVLRLYDPQAMANAQRLFPEEAGRLMYCDSAYEAARGAQALLLVTEWDEFRRLDFARLRELMEVPILVDGRNLFDPEEMRRLGFEYLCMGRGSSGLSVPIPPGVKPVSEARMTQGAQLFD